MVDPLRVLQVHNLYVRSGGEDTIADAEAQLLRESGHVVNSYRVRNPEGKAKAIAGLAGAAWNPRQVGRLRREIGEFAPDVAHVHNTWYTLSSGAIHALHDAGVPTVMTLQNYRLLCTNALFFRDGKVCTDCLGGSVWQSVKHGCYHESPAQTAVVASVTSIARARHTWDRIDRFLAASEFVKGIYVQAGFDPERIIVRPNLAPDPGRREGPPSQSPTVVYVGRLSAEKGADVVIDAWERAGAAVSDLELLVVGDGPMREELEARNVAGVRFAGWVNSDEVAALMLTARASLMPSQVYETFGRSMVEAMAAGMPVVASDIATPGEIVGEIGPEWLVEPRDLDGWGAAISRLADDAVVDAAGQRARELFDAKYSPQITLNSLVAAYRTAIAVRRG